MGTIHTMDLPKEQAIASCVSPLSELALSCYMRSIRDAQSCLSVHNVTKIWNILRKSHHYIETISYELQKHESLHRGNLVCQTTIEYPVPLATAVMDPQKQELIVAGDEGKIYAVNLLDSQTYEIILPGVDSPIRALQMTADGHYLIAAAFDGKIHIWDRNAKKYVKSIPQAHVHEGRVHSIETLALLRNDTVLMSAGLDGRVRFWDFRNPASDESIKLITETIFKKDANTDFIPDKSIRAVAAAHDECTLAVAVGNAIALCDTTTLAHIKPYAIIEGAHDNVVTALVLMRNQQVLISAAVDGYIKIWDISNRAKPICIMTLQGSVQAVSALTLTADDTILISVGLDNTLKMWNITSLNHPQLISMLSGHTSWIRGLLADPENRSIVSAGSDKTVRIWTQATTAYGLLSRLITRMGIQQDTRGLFGNKNRYVVDDTGKNSQASLDNILALQPQATRDDEGPTLELAMRQELRPHELANLSGQYEKLMKKLLGKEAQSKLSFSA